MDRRAYNSAWRASHREERHAYNVAHREEKRVYDAARYAAHREENRARGAAYYAAHREERLAADAAYRAAHLEEARARSREYAAAHREEARDRAARHRATHPEDVRACCRNRDARLRNSLGTHTAADIRAQYARQFGQCYWCGAGVAWRDKHVDHVIPIIRGGSNGPENLVIACAPCNLSKNDRLPQEFSDRLC